MATLGIPTSYGGIDFRSRTEARWAAFFDLCGGTWDYEPLDLRGYIPDFVVYFFEPLIVEVKGGALTIDALMAHAGKIDRSGWEGEAVIVGATPGKHPEIGIGNDNGKKGFGLSWAPMMFQRCQSCARLSMYHSVGSYHCRNNGCSDGDHCLRDEATEPYWREACNMTRWMPKSMSDAR